MSGNDFAVEMRRRRQHAGISLRELARRAYIDAGYACRLEGGKQPPSQKIAATLDTVLGADGALLASFTPRPRAASAPRPLAVVS